jgi:hypothetical protein
MFRRVAIVLHCTAAVNQSALEVLTDVVELHFWALPLSLRTTQAPPRAVFCAPASPPLLRTQLHNDHVAASASTSLAAYAKSLLIELLSVRWTSRFVEPAPLARRAPFGNVSIHPN